MRSQRINRRDFLKVAGFGGAALLFGKRIKAIGARFPNRVPADPFVPDAEVSITATDKRMQILSGTQTRVYSYEGQLISGSGVTLQTIPDSYLGPILRVKSGTKLRIFFKNNLIEDSVIHPHGLRVPEECDGHPMQAIRPGQTKVYEFEVIDRAGPYWFHPHPHMRTAEQVMMGLAGLLYVWDPEEEMAVPGASTGANDIPIVIQDRSFDRNNQIAYQPNMMWGFLGDHILVNGKINTTISLEPRAYRLRLLNGSNARTYKLAWSNNLPLNVIGADGGLLPAVVSKNYVMLMPGERVDVWADFSSLAGKQVVLRSLAFQAGGMGMGGMRGMGMTHAPARSAGVGGTTNGTAFDILTVNVGKEATTKPVLGPLPASTVQYDANNVPNYNAPRPFVIGMGHMMTWTINGRVFEMESIAEDEKVDRDEIIAWEWINNSPIPHPMHIHNVQFQVLQRTPPASMDSYNTVNQGLIDHGWKDTVSVWPGERVKIAMRFGPYTGMYMYHCHILEHEDMTMMRNLMVMDPSMPGLNSKKSKPAREELLAGLFFLIPFLLAGLFWLKFNISKPHEAPEAERVLTAQVGLPFQVLIPAYMPKQFNRKRVEIITDRTGPNGEKIIQLIYSTRKGDSLTLSEWLPMTQDYGKTVSNARHCLCVCQTAQQCNMLGMELSVGAVQIKIEFSAPNLLDYDQMQLMLDTLGPAVNRQVYSAAEDVPLSFSVPPPVEIQTGSDGVQEVALVVSPQGYSPVHFAVKKDVPVRLIFRQLGQVGCGNELIFQWKAQKSSTLVLASESDKQIFEFTPDERGEFRFNCPHLIYRGVMTVTD